MPTWPTNKPSSNKFNADSDSIKQSRADLKTMSDAVNDIVDFVDTTGIADGKILIYNASNSRLEVGEQSSGITNPILFGNAREEDSAGQVVGKLLFESKDSATIDSIFLGFTETEEHQTSNITLTSRGGTDNSIALTVGAINGGQDVKNTYTFATTAIDLTGNGINQTGVGVSVNRLTIDGPPGTNVNYPVPSITTGSKDLYIGANAGSSLNNGKDDNLFTPDSAGDPPNQLDMNGALIYFDALRKNIYINTVTEVDSTGQPEDDGAIYLNKQKWPNQDGSNNQVLKTNGSGVLSWGNEGSAPNVFTTFSGDSGSTTANSTTDTLEIRGGTDIGTSVSGDVLTINYTGSAGGKDITAGDNITISSPDSAGGITISQSQLNATLNMNDQQLSNMQIKNFGEIVHDLGTTSGTLTPDPNNGSVQKITLNNNLTLNALSNVASGDSLTLLVTQDGTGGRTLSSTMKFSGGAKTLSTGANAIDVITIFYDGTNYLASLSTNFS